MSRVLVLGASGMLGNSVYKEFRESGLEVTGTKRNPVEPQDSEFKEFEVANNFRNFLDENLSNYDYVINCIGLIPHKFSSDDSQNLSSAIIVNSIFPNVLAEIASKFDCRVIQIATDCVFSGLEGNYSEESRPDPKDTYGVTKLCGEISAPNVMNIRCSVIGLEEESAFSLLSWFLSRPKNTQVNGYTNQIWNGITSLAFAKIVKSIIQKNSFAAGTQHLIPSDSISKYELIKLFAVYGDRSDLDIQKWGGAPDVDRTLITIDPVVNEMMWKTAGYSNVPLIEEMIAELFHNSKEGEAK